MNIKNKKKYKIIIVLIIITLIGFVSGTSAYHVSRRSLNIFKNKKQASSFVETFESPEYWVPGATAPNVVYAINTTNTDVAVRISYTESWISANGNLLSGIQDGNRASLLNLTNQNDWIKVDNYYVYNKKLALGERTSNFMESVTFNPTITASINCNTSDDGLTKTCASTGDGYDGATYKLVIKVETIQFDVANDIWNLADFIWNSSE